MLITGLAFALHPSAIVGFIPPMVERKDLQAAHALLGAARTVSLMLGAAFAGILVATVGAGPTLAIDGLSIWALCNFNFCTPPQETNNH
ncbi:MAG: putative MFS family arabinose efflux permease [Candidatus Azotimanducaceae bacterium]|jgi:predicted MFS family arabinose efflux permease